MKTHLTLGAALLLTLGSAVAGTLMYSPATSGSNALVEATAPQVEQVSAETIAMWKATAASTDYVAPKVPI